ncbi:MAG: aminotransferase class I/II-fold pyridoxal phosphate-dependent enzyme, partial [Actinomycetota bacterium]
EHKPDIVFVNSPNNPTGNVVRPEAIENVCRSGDFLVVVDEAYGEFSGETCLPLIKKYKNLAVVKTFSKAFRLAGARVGYALADEGIVSGLEKVRLPYNLNALSQVAAAMVWKKRSAILGVVDEIIAERERVAKILTEMDGATPYPSQANFILFKTGKDAKGVYQRLVTSGVRIRDFSSVPRLKNCLRVTIGTPAENNVFLDVLRESL